MIGSGGRGASESGCCGIRMLRLSDERRLITVTPKIKEAIPSPNQMKMERVVDVTFDRAIL